MSCKFIGWHDSSNPPQKPSKFIRTYTILWIWQRVNERASERASERTNQRTKDWDEIVYDYCIAVSRWQYLVWRLVPDVYSSPHCVIVYDVRTRARVKEDTCICIHISLCWNHYKSKEKKKENEKRRIKLTIMK